MASILEDYTSLISDWLRDYKTNNEIVTLLKGEGIVTSEKSLRRLYASNPELQELSDIRVARNRLASEAEAPGFSVNGNGDLTVTLPLEDEFEAVSNLTIERVMARHQLDPEEWECNQVMPNVWQGQRAGGEVINFYQFKLIFKKKVPLKVILPAVFVPPVDAFKVPNYSQPLLVVVAGDQQEPFAIEGLKSLFLDWLAENKPDIGVLNGDLMNLGYIGRHKDNPAWDDNVQEALNAAGNSLYNIRNASSDTQWSLLHGNHDDRIKAQIIERNERLYGIKPVQYPGDVEGDEIYSLNHLLKLRQLGIEYVEPSGTYDFEHVVLSEAISVRHGHLTGKYAPLQTAERLGNSVVLGHTHKQSINKKTLWNSITNTYNVVTAIEHGCMCELEGGLGYANGGFPDWQPGFATVQIWPDGNFTADLATYEQKGVLRWRDQEFTL